LRVLAAGVAAVALCPTLLADSSAAAAGTRPAHARAAASAGTWGKAEQVPGTAALNKGGSAAVYSVSCAAPGDCSAGGNYVPSGSFVAPKAFVVTESGGRWGKAAEVVGSAAFNKAGATVDAVSCAAAGDCGAGGQYGGQAFVVNQAGGRWGMAEQVPGLAALNRAGLAQIVSVSCAAPGQCSAGGYYASRVFHGLLVTQPFVVTETGGTWGKAEQVPGTAALNKGGTAQVDSVSCPAPGTCGAGGDYSLTNGNTEAFVVNETGGTWGTAEKVPGTAALNKRGAETTSVSCAAAGQCGAGGYYLDGSGGQQAFVVSQAGGTWGTAEQVPGTAALNKGRFAQIFSVSCAAAGRCGAGGLYASGIANGRPVEQAFIVSETTGAGH
jgi:hypothetical protein